MSVHRSLVMLGLPRTGKSAYLGTFWHMVEEPDIAAVEVAELPQDLQHVRALADAMRGLEVLARTRSEEHEELNLSVVFAGEHDAVLRIPDLSGELLQAIIEQRTMPEELAQELGQAAGLLVFLHPMRISLPTGLSVAGAPDDEDREEESVELTNDTDEGDAATNTDRFSNAKACTAAQLIDCLENALELMAEDWPVRVALVVSAFDLTHGRSPDQWLVDRVPALKSFLDTNADRVEWTVFGVSAQGGRRGHSADLLPKDLHERAFARNAQGEEVEFSDPVRWALGWL